MVNFPAKIDTGAAAPLHDCTLLDVSAEGARLTTDHIAGLPPDFTVLLSYRGVPRRRCHVVWRSPDEVGVQFLEEKRIIRRRRIFADEAAEATEERSAATADER